MAWSPECSNCSYASAMTSLVKARSEDKRYGNFVCSGMGASLILPLHLINPCLYMNNVEFSRPCLVIFFQGFSISIIRLHTITFGNDLSKYGWRSQVL